MNGLLDGIANGRISRNHGSLIRGLLDRNGTVNLQYNDARSNNLNPECILSNYLVKEYF
jgi:hypothetical protein